MYLKANTDGYARAIFELANENNELLITTQILEAIMWVSEENEDFIAFLSNPAITLEEKFSLIEQNFASLSPSELIVNFLKVLVVRRVIHLITRIIKVFLKYANDYLGIKEAIIYSAFKLSDERLEKFKKYLSKKYNAQIKLKNIIRPEIISGFRIEVDSDVIEQNIATDLDKLGKLIIKRGV
ncbi:ATP synthase F1 subunit delta [Mycoplasma sp. CSL7475-4]|uniref:ATP synthase F1 subunit delta n=1 Tax=Mycoplasma sp. CSL7475-4 TaxID=2973942 RepID=UPI00216B4767|nr:ATP synthase F1 subunit delta [Mycoplasma sp. CSL7475-4]MCS4537100.1 ATP synthase F1 subunit delta [Mycoplasma sp. CSL7475-4]